MPSVVDMFKDAMWLKVIGSEAAKEWWSKKATYKSKLGWVNVWEE